MHAGNTARVLGFDRETPVYEIPSEGITRATTGTMGATESTGVPGSDDIRAASGVVSFVAFRSFPAHAAGPLECTFEGRLLSVSGNDQVMGRFAFDGSLRILEWHCSPAEGVRVVMAALDGLFANGAARAELDLHLDSAQVEAGVLAAGAAVRDGTRLLAGADMLWQIAELWSPGPAAAWPLRYAIHDGKRHPLRPPKPRGTVYARYIPWLGRTLSLRTAGLERDLPLLHRWMNDPEVDYFWQEAGEIEKHRAYLAGLIDDPHMLPLIASFDDQPFGYFEVYWARENRIAPFYDAHDHDRGWHVLIGEPAFRGKAYLTAWFPAIQHFQFLDDPRTQRIVGEPRADHERQLANLDKAGFARLKTFDFPHKRAVLVMLLREEFFGQRLLLPRPPRKEATDPSASLETRRPGQAI